MPWGPATNYCVPMSSQLYTFVGHRDLPFANPFGEGSMERAIGVLSLAPGASVADFGAGLCELPIRLAERGGAETVAVELSPLMAARARERIHERLVSRGARGGVTVHEGDAGAFRLTVLPGRFDLTICIGSSHALGGYANALGVLRRLTKPGGQVLVGEGLWKREPAADYLRFTGMSESDFGTHATNLEMGVEAGMTAMWAIAATEREFDEYEWAHARAIERFAAERVRAGGEDDKDARLMLDKSRNWRRAYMRWGRATLGFGLYLFRVDGDEPA